MEHLKYSICNPQFSIRCRYALCLDPPPFTFNLYPSAFTLSAMPDNPPSAFPLPNSGASGLPIGQQQPDFPEIGFGNQLCPAQWTFTLGGLFGQYMAGAGFPIDYFAGAGSFKALGSRTICLYFRHISTSLNWKARIAGNFNFTKIDGVSYQKPAHAKIEIDMIW